MGISITIFQPDGASESQQSHPGLAIIQREITFNNSNPLLAMNERFHIIITGEDGQSSAFQLSKKKCAVGLITAVVLLVCICVFGYMTTGSYFSNKLLTRKADELQAQLIKSEAAGCDYAEQLKKLQQKHAEILASTEKEHADSVASLQQENENRLADQQAKLASIEKKHADTIASLQQENENRLADQQAKFDLENTTLQLENVKLMTTAVSELHERSELIETVMDNIGVELKKSKKKSASSNSGGPFIPDGQQSYDNLLKKTEKYLNTIRRIPLGKPLTGNITSEFGKRSDPLNNKKAIHEGVDIRGEKGDRIRATAGGKVLTAFKNGSYGNYVKIDHGNGYQTIYAHMQNYLVKKGETVKQGQVIGQVGTSGRSTGPHLHYEILLNQKPVNPVKFMKVADLSYTFNTYQE